MRAQSFILGFVIVLLCFTLSYQAELYISGARLDQKDNNPRTFLYSTVTNVQFEDQSIKDDSLCLIHFEVFSKENPSDELLKWTLWFSVGNIPGSKLKEGFIFDNIHGSVWNEVTTGPIYLTSVKFYFYRYDGLVIRATVVNQKGIWLESAIHLDTSNSASVKAYFAKIIKDEREMIDKIRLDNGEELNSVNDEEYRSAKEITAKWYFGTVKPSPEQDKKERDAEPIALEEKSEEPPNISTADMIPTGMQDEMVLNVEK